MTDLQASLFAIGGAIVAGVITYNKWQEFKARRSVERAFSDGEEDVLMRSGPSAPAERREPTLEAAAPVLEPAAPAVPDVADAAADRDGAAILAGPETEAAAPEAAPELVPEPEPAIPDAAPRLPIDELIDCVVPLALEAPLRGEKILQVAESLRQVGGKPVHYVGQAESGAWEEIARGGVYREVVLGIQMANRISPLNELEYSEFVTRLGHLAQELGAEPDLPDMAEVMPAARSLHQFIAEYGAQLSVNVRAGKAPWPLATLLAALQRQGFDLRPDGRLVMPDGEGGILFSLATNAGPAADATGRLTLLLDVPCVAPGRDAFNAMAACARSLAARLDGVVVDDGDQPLSAQTLEEISGQVQSFYAEMETMQVAAGSPRALRLFA